MQAVSFIIIIIGLLFLGFEIFKFIAKRSGGHRPGQ